MSRRIQPPSGLGSRGRRVWRNCLRQDAALEDSDNPSREIVLEAARLADHLETLDGLLSAEGLMVELERGPKAHPALVELGKCQALLARLIVSLRLPDEVTGRKPQRRSLRTPGAQVPGGKVTPLDRARRAAGGA